jgi:hypothetical protein
VRLLTLHRLSGSKSKACPHNNNLRYELEDTSHSSSVDSFKSMEWSLERDIQNSMIPHAIACHCQPQCMGCRTQTSSPTKAEPTLRNSMRKIIKPVAAMISKARKTGSQKRPRPLSTEASLPQSPVEVSGISKPWFKPELPGDVPDSTYTHQYTRSELQGNHIGIRPHDEYADVEEGVQRAPENISPPVSPYCNPSHAVCQSIDGMMLENYPAAQRPMEATWSPCISPLSLKSPFASLPPHNPEEEQIASMNKPWTMQDKSAQISEVAELSSAAQISCQPSSEVKSLFETESPSRWPIGPDTRDDIKLSAELVGSDAYRSGQIEFHQLQTETENDLANHRLYPYSKWHSEMLVASSNFNAMETARLSWEDPRVRMILLTAVKSILHGAHASVRRTFPLLEQGAESIVDLWYEHFRASWESAGMCLTYENVYCFVLGWIAVLEKYSEIVLQMSSFELNSADLTEPVAKDFPNYVGDCSMPDVAVQCVQGKRLRTKRIDRKRRTRRDSKFQTSRPDPNRLRSPQLKRSNWGVPESMSPPSVPR